jgi:hypothetical protein
LPRGSAILLAVLAVGTAAIAADRTSSPGEEAIAALRLAQTSGPRCAAKRGEIAYVGPTDEALLTCLSAHPKAISVRITSLGGPVVEAMEAARTIAARNMDVSVAGFCGSSCGNYIIAAARRLTVLPDSAIMLHGAPLADAQAQRAQAVAALKAAGIPQRNLTDELVTNAVAQLRQQRRLHDRFAMDFRVGSEWYDLTAYYRALATIPGEGPMLLVSPNFARECLGHPKIAAFWYPRTERQRESMQQLLGSDVMFMGADLPTPASCR